MSKLVKKQLAEIRRETSRIELQNMREHVRQKKRALVRLQSEEKSWTTARKVERKTRLKDLHRALAQARKLEHKSKAEKLRAIAERRRQFEQWWAGVRKERATRLAEIQHLKVTLKGWLKDLPKRRQQAVAEISAAAQRQFESFDVETAKQHDALERAIQQARRELRADEYDLKVWTANRGREKRQVVRAIRKPKGEATAELVSEIENNLTTAEEWAWWRAERKTLLRNAKEQGVTEGDAIAELIRERVELEPERAIEYLQADADAWVEAEVRKAGFAA